MTNDRKSNWNADNNQPMHAPYKMQNKRKKKIVDKVGSFRSQPLAYLYHKNGFPEQYRKEFREITVELFTFVNKEKELIFFDYTSILANANEYIEKVINLTCKAYNLESLMFNEFDRQCVFLASTYSKAKALSLLEDIFCNRGEALSALSSEELEILKTYDTNRKQYDYNRTRLETIIHGYKSELKTLEEARKFVDDDDVSNKIMEKHNWIKNMLNKEQSDLEQLETGYRKYREDISDTLDKIWNKVKYFVPK